MNETTFTGTKFKKAKHFSKQIYTKHKFEGHML